MIVERYTWHVKQGHWPEYVELIKAERERTGDDTARIYTPMFGLLGVVAWEREFESMEEREQYWQGWLQEPESQTFMQKLRELQDTGGTHELWGLA